MKSAASMIVAKMPPPDRLHELEADEGTDHEAPEEGDEDEGSEAAALSAMEDFLSDVGLNPKKSEKALKALKEVLSHLGCYEDKDEPEEL